MEEPNKGEAENDNDERPPTDCAECADDAAPPERDEYPIPFSACFTLRGSGRDESRVDRERQVQMHEIITTIEIDGLPRAVWDVLVEFEAHAQWNPFVRRIEGSPREGETLRVSIQPVGGKIMTFRPRVIQAVPERELRWLGRVLCPGVFDGEHYFTIEPVDEGRRTRFIHGERFSGLLVPLLRKNLDRGTRAGFEAMNQALKARVEDSSRR
jgi:hypothetical protein